MIGYDSKRGALSEATTRDHAARHLGVTPGRISQMMSDGQIGYVTVGRRRYPSWPSVQAVRVFRDMLKTGGDNE